MLSADPPRNLRWRARRVGVLSFILAAGQLAGGGAAWALCPNCLGQTRSVTPTLELIGLFLLLPFLVAFAVFRVIRRLSLSSGVPPRDNSVPPP